jgi:hypothetical protein
MGLKQVWSLDFLEKCSYHACHTNPIPPLRLVPPFVRTLGCLCHCKYGHKFPYFSSKMIFDYGCWCLSINNAPHFSVDSRQDTIKERNKQ